MSAIDTGLAAARDTTDWAGCVVAPRETDARDVAARVDVELGLIIARLPTATRDGVAIAVRDVVVRAVVVAAARGEEFVRDGFCWAVPRDAAADVFVVARATVVPSRETAPAVPAPNNMNTMKISALLIPIERLANLQFSGQVKYV